MKKAALLLVAPLVLTGCAVVQYADGKRVSLRYDQSIGSLPQEEADKACLASGGKAPARLISEVPAHSNLPASMVPRVATFACAD